MHSVLIIDDDPEWIIFLQKTLASSQNLEVRSSVSLEDAKDQISKKDIDIVIADLRLDKRERKPFKALGNLIFSLSLDKKITRIPIIVLTGLELDGHEIIEALNNYSGWIWGWYEKRTFNEDQFRDNIILALNAKTDVKNRGMPKPLQYLLMALGIFVVASGATWIFAQSFPSNEIENLLTITSIVAILLGILVIILSDPDRIKTLMPFLEAWFKKDR
jgi:CheY-like chemotaxis protein